MQKKRFYSINKRAAVEGESADPYKLIIQIALGIIIAFFLFYIIWRLASNAKP